VAAPRPARSASATSTAATRRQRRAPTTTLVSRPLLPHTTLYWELRLRPDESIEQIVERLAGQYVWTSTDRLYYAARLDDIRRTILSDVVFEQPAAPSARYLDACRRLRECDD
jgi:hypothetical protein